MKVLTGNYVHNCSVGSASEDVSAEQGTFAFVNRRGADFDAQIGPYCSPLWT